jgi:hypothetical protein
MKGEQGQIEIDVPRDRQGTFEPQLVQKGQTRLEGFDEKILATYARGMTTRDIQAQLQELYGLEVSPTGCATSFTSTAIRFESILHRFSVREKEKLSPTLVRGQARVLNEPGIGASIENTAALCILWARLIQADESLARTAGQVEAFCTPMASAGPAAIHVKARRLSRVLGPAR